MRPISPNLWFDNNAEEARDFYVSIFPNSETLETVRYTESGPGVPGSVVSVAFRLNGTEFVGINGGPHFTFSEAISFAIECEDQAEVDYYWSKLLEGGEAQQCGWLKDKFGVSWQVVPTALREMLTDTDEVRRDRVIQVMFEMVKLDIAGLQHAYDNE
jgi:predicted 3-demethylubiquinone-9 3-methyltransferase (glyoxalase superfamily)